MNRVIADVDTALGIRAGDIDDAYALALLAAFPDQIALEGITVTGGNVTLPSASRSTRLVCELLGLDAPVAEGEAGPIDGRELKTGHSIVLNQGHRQEEWTLDREPAIPPSPFSALQLLERATRTAGLDLLAVAPLSNIAAFLKMYPERRHAIRRIVTMGGLFNPDGGAEFNTQTDPVAAEAVYRSGIPLVIIPLEMTIRTRLHGHHVTAWNCGQSNWHTFAEGTHSWIEEMKLHFEMDGCHLHDPLAAAYLLRPELFETRGIIPSIDTRTGRTSIVQWDESSPARLVTDFDEDGFSQLFHSAMDFLVARAPRLERASVG